MSKRWKHWCERCGCHHTDETAVIIHGKPKPQAAEPRRCPYCGYSTIPCACAGRANVYNPKAAESAGWKCCGEKSDCYQCDKGPTYSEPEGTIIITHSPHVIYEIKGQRFVPHERLDVAIKERDDLQAQVDWLQSSPMFDVHKALKKERDSLENELGYFQSGEHFRIILEKDELIKSLQAECDALRDAIGEHPDFDTGAGMAEYRALIGRADKIRDARNK